MSANNPSSYAPVAPSSSSSPSPATSSGASATGHASAPDAFAAGAVQALSTTLYDARSRAATAWLLGLGVVTFAPLAMASRNGWAFAGLMAFVAACVARWVAGLLFERGEGAQRQPLPVLILQAAIGIGWAAAGLAAMLDPYGWGPALVLVSSATVCAACVPMLQGHRDACWWLMAPLTALPIAMAFSPQPWALPLAAMSLAGMAAAAWHAQRTQGIELDRIEAILRARHVHAEWKKEQQAASTAGALLAARERELGLMWQHAGVNIVRVNGFVIEGISEPLAQRLGQPGERFLRRDVLSLFRKEHHAALEAVIKRRNLQGAATAGATPHRERVALAAPEGVTSWVDLVIDPDRSGPWLVLDAGSAAAGIVPAAPTAAAAAASPSQGGVLDRAGLERRLQTHADRRERATVVAAALSGLDAVAAVHGDAAVDRIREVIGQRLEAVCRSREDAVAALDGACWALVATGETSDLTLSLMCDRVHSAMATPHTVGDTTVQLSVSVDSLRLELDTQRTAASLGLIDEFVAHARAARRRVAGETAHGAVAGPGGDTGANVGTGAHGGTSTGTHVGASAGAIWLGAAGDAARPQATQAIPARQSPHPTAAAGIATIEAAAVTSSRRMHTPREETELAAKHATATARPAAGAAAPVSIERIHIEPSSDDDDDQVLPC